MAQPKLAAYTSDGATLLETIALDSATGDVSAATAFRFVNDDVAGSVDTANLPSITVREVDTGTGEAVLRGLRAVDERWIRLRSVGTGSPTGTHVASGWYPVGRGRMLLQPALASGEWHDMEIVYAPPFSAPEGSVLFILTAEDNQRTIPLEQGHTESSRDGILNGIGDGAHSELIVGGPMTATGSPDADVNFPDMVWIYQGTPHVLLAHAETMNLTDGTPTTIGATEAYWARYSLAAGPGITVTKSVKFLAASPNVDDVPAVPAGAIDLGYAFVTHALTIGGADLTFEGIVGRFAFANNSGRVLTVGPGAARIDNTILPKGQTNSQKTLDASQASVSVWLLPDGTLAATNDGSRPSSRAYLLCAVPTGSSSITMASLIDYRDCIGTERQTHSFKWRAIPSGGDKACSVHRSARTGYLRVPRGMILAADSLGSGNTMGILRIEFKVNGTTVFTSSGSDNRMPRLNYNSSPQVDTAAVPEVLEVPPFALLEASIVFSTAFDGTGPSGITLDVTIEVP